MMRTPLLTSSPPVPKAKSRWRGWRGVAAALLLAGGLARPAAAQVDTYTLAASTGTFTPLTGSTSITGMAADTYLSPAIPLGFSFVFDGASYTSVKASSDGYLTFSTTATSSTLTNNLATGSATNRPLIAPLWDDLDGRPTGATGVGSYLTTGTAPNRVFTFEWRNWEWNWQANTSVISFQAKLYEGTNRIEFVYSPEAGAVNSGSASIGLAGIGTGSGSFLSLNNTSTTPTASSTTETTTINAKPAAGQIYAFTPAPVTGCQAPRLLTTANLTSTTVDLSWTTASTGASFTVEYGAQGFTPGTSAGTTRPVTGNTTTLTGLAPATAYDFYVTQNCGGTLGNSPRSGPVSFTTRNLPPTNDDCANAVTLTPGAAGATCSSATSGTVESATATAGLAAPVGTADDDVWYKFVATSTSHVVTLTGSGDYVQQLFSGTCSSLTSLGFYDPNVRAYPGLTVGQTYYLRIYSYSATAQTGTSAAFTVCVTTQGGTPPANDDCANAVTLTPAALNAACAGATSGTLENATATPFITAPVGTSDDDVWYRFVATATAHTVTLTGTADYVQQLFTGTCGSLAAFDFSDPNAKVYSGLTVGTTYYLRVYSSSPVPQVGTAATFTVCVTTPTPPPVNDNPCGAVALTLSSTCTPVSSTNDQATTTAINGYANPGTCGIATSPKDVWFTVTTAATGSGSTAMQLAVTGVPAGLVRLFSTTNGCSGPFTQVSCFAGTTNNTSAGSSIITGLAPSTTYYVSVAGYGSTDTQGAFTICASLPPTCLAPTALRADTLTTTSAVLHWTSASGTGPYTVEYGPQGFTLGTGTIVPNITRTRYVAIGLTPNTQYQFYVTQNCGGALGSSTTTGPVAFTTLALAPANDECAGAISLPVQYGSACTTSTLATNAGATASTGAPAPINCGFATGTAGYQGGDVWFSVVVPASGTVTVETLEEAGGNISDTGLAIYSGTCGTLVQEGCDDDGSPSGLFSLLTLSGRTPGEVLYVRVWEYNNDATGSFRVCVRSTSNCPVPVAPSASNLTGTTATLNWSVAAPTAGATFVVEYGPQGFTQGQGTIVRGITTTSTTISGLLPNTAYCFYVQQDCGTVSGSSTAVGPVCFTTPNPPAANDEPCTATALPVTTTGACAPVSSTNVGATTTVPNGYANPGCSTSLTPKDVWFSMTTAAGTGSKTLRFTTTGNPAGQVRLFTAASCSTAFTAVSCNATATNQTVGTFQVTGLLPATRYYVMVAGYGSSDAVGPFTICAQDVTTTATRNELPGGEVTVFPNPSNTGTVTLRISGITQTSTVHATLYNALGQQVLVQQLPVRGGAVEQPLTVKGLARGIYTLRTQVGDYTITRKVVLE